MNRRDFVKILGAGSFLAGFGAGSESTDRPSFLWITCEDMSPNLGCFGDRFAITPNLDQLAAEGIKYTQAFTHAPVCAPSRSGLITGIYPQSLGTHHMRSKAPLPAQVRCFTAYLRDAGYYCSNCSKEDYNFNKPADSWDDSSRNAHWRNRARGQPFFSVFNLTTTHEGQIRLPDVQFADRTSALEPSRRHDPQKVPVPPYHPDTPEVRKDWAHYYDLISVMDMQVVELLHAIETDGLADNTIVFFFSDHGAGMPRSKRWLYDSGLHVPLIVRFPEKYRHLAPAARGSTIDRLVAFVDFGPTLLSLAGIPIPKTMQGRPFLGEQAAEPRQYVYAGRDRMDERYDCSRAVRDKRFKYIRNLVPHLSRAQYQEYMYEMPTMQVWAKMAREGSIEGPPTLFVQETKPGEELYDTEKDRWELNNLANRAEHAETLERMRKELAGWMTQTHDLGLLPESEMHRRTAGRAFYDLAMDDRAHPLAELMSATGIAQGPPTENSLIGLLSATDAPVRFWALIGLHQHRGKDPRPWLDQVEKCLADPAPSVRIAAAELLFHCGRNDPATTALIQELQNEDEWVRLHAANVFDLLGLKSERATVIFSNLLADKNQYVVRVARHYMKI